MPKKAKGPTGSAADFIPRSPTLPKLRAAAEHCRGCDLYALATQTVFGEGPNHASTMLVGEQPGDAEDRAGRPFVGPAGRLLDKALEEAGFDRDDVYVTNAVKHFKWAKDAKSVRRIHKTPNTSEVRACMPWLEQEIALVQPRVIVCLGATAAKALLGRAFSVLKSRGMRIESPWAEAVFATVHPSSVLRAPPADREEAQAKFVDDLRAAAAHLKASGRRKTSSRAAGASRTLRTWPSTQRQSGTSRKRTPSSRA